MFSCTTYKGVMLFDNHMDLPNKYVDMKYGFSFNMYLNSNITNNPSKIDLKNIAYPNQYFKNRDFRTLVTNDVNVIILVDVINRRKSKKDIVVKSVIIKDSLQLFKYTAIENDIHYEIIEYHKKLDFDSLRITFLTFQNKNVSDKYPYLEEYALPIVKTVETNVFKMEAKKIEENVFGYMFDMYKKHGNYFQGLYFLDQLNDTIKNTIKNEINMYNSFAGNYSHLREKEKSKRNSKNDIKYIDAKNHITEVANNYDFILFNEDHLNPYCRYFIRQMLPKLKEEGYTNIGIETMSYIKHDVNKYGFPIHGSGFFTDEPQMANLIRDAVTLGFTVFPYEKNSYECDTCKTQIEKQQFRETGQANNIIKYSESNSGKTIIVAGHGHIYKSNDNPIIKFMAEVLKQKSNKNILTINQTFQEIYPTPNVKIDCIPLDSVGRYYISSKLRGKVDIQIIHNDIHHFNNHNDFYRILGHTTSFEVPIKSNDRGYLAVYSEKENILFPKKRIPLSISVFDAKETIIRFDLGKGNYIVMEFDIYGVPINITKIKI